MKCPCLEGPHPLSARGLLVQAKHQTSHDPVRTTLQRRPCRFCIQHEGMGSSWTSPRAALSFPLDYWFPHQSWTRRGATVAMAGTLHGAFIEPVNTRCTSFKQHRRQTSPALMQDHSITAIPHELHNQMHSAAFLQEVGDDIERCYVCPLNTALGEFCCLYVTNAIHVNMLYHSDLQLMETGCCSSNLEPYAALLR